MMDDDIEPDNIPSSLKGDIDPDEYCDDWTYREKCRCSCHREKRLGCAICGCGRNIK